MSNTHRGATGLARGLRRTMIAMVGAGALALAVTGTVAAQAALPAAAIHPDASFQGYEASFVAADGHIRNVDPNNNLENHGPSLVVGNSDAVGMSPRNGGGFLEAFRSDENGGNIFIGNNNGLQTFSAGGHPFLNADPNTTPALAFNPAALDDSGAEEIAWADGGGVQITRDGFNNGNLSNPGPIEANTSPSVAAFTNGSNGFILAWADPNGFINYDDGTGVHKISITTEVWNGGVAGDGRIRPNTSPSVASNGAHWEIDWQDMSGHLVRTSDTDRGGSGEFAETLVGSPRVVALTQGATGAFMHVTENNGGLFLNGVDQHQSVDEGNNPAIAADGNGNWKIVFVGIDLHLHSLDNTGHTRTFSTVTLSGDASPSIIAMLG